MEKLWRLFCRLGNSLDLDENLAAFDAELQRLVEFSSISIHFRRDGELSPIYLAGPDFQTLPVVEVSRPAPGAGPGGPRRLNHRLAVPLDRLGAVAVYRERPFTAAELEILTAAATKLLAAITNALAYRSAAEQAGIAGAGALFRRLDAELSRCVRESASLAVLACKIDGAAAGREAVWSRLRETCREYDFAAHSGDEFVLVLAGFTPRDLPEKLARINAIVSVWTGISVAVGAAFFPEDGKDAEDLLAAASRRLYA